MVWLIFYFLNLFEGVLFGTFAKKKKKKKSINANVLVFRVISPACLTKHIVTKQLYRNFWELPP